MKFLRHRLIKITWVRRMTESETQVVPELACGVLWHLFKPPNSPFIINLPQSDPPS